MRNIPAGINPFSTVFVLTEEPDDFTFVRGIFTSAASALLALEGAYGTLEGAKARVCWGEDIPLLEITLNEFIIAEIPTNHDVFGEE